MHFDATLTANETDVSNFLAKSIVPRPAIRRCSYDLRSNIPSAIARRDAARRPEFEPETFAADGRALLKASTTTRLTRRDTTQPTFVVRLFTNFILVEFRRVFFWIDRRRSNHEHRERKSHAGDFTRCRVKLLSSILALAIRT